MMRRYVLLVLFSMQALHGACTFGPSGINQWELLYQVANCVNQCSGSSGGSCSSLDSVSDVLSSKISQIDSVVTEIDSCLVGTAIMQADIPLIITVPGKYIVCEDISDSSNLIDIQADNVTLNLNGHVLASLTGTCVTVSGVSDIVIENGSCTSALQAVYVDTGSSDVTIRGLNVYNAAEPSIHAVGAHAVNVLGCAINGRNGTAIIPNSGMIRVDTCSEILIEDTAIFGGNTFNSIPGAACVVTNTQTAEGGVTIRRCTAEVLNEFGFVLETALDSCILEDCFVSEFIGTLKEGYRINGSGSCQLIRCSAEKAGIGFSLVNYTNVVLQDCTALVCATSGFLFQSSNGGVAGGCVATDCSTGFNMQGDNALLSACKATANTIAGFSIAGANNVLQQCVSSGNSGSGINNLIGTNTFLVDTRSSSIVPPAYQLNGAADIFGTATIVPGTCCCSVNVITQATIPLTITVPGKYIVCEDISDSSNLIDIQADNVILDLNGHVLESLTGRCVTVSGSSEIVIENGFCTSALQAVYVDTGSSNVTIQDVQIFNAAEPSIFATNTEWLTIAQCAITGRNGTLLANGMIRVDTCAAILIEDSTIIGGNTFNSIPLAACVVTNTQSSNGGATIRRCTAEVLNEQGFVIDTSVDACIIEDCYVSQFVGTVKEGYSINGSGSCQLIGCTASAAGIGFSMVSHSNAVLQNCIAFTCTNTGFRFQSANGVVEGCVASGCQTGFSMQGTNTLLSECKATANSISGFSIIGSNTVLQQCVASGNSGSGINNTTGTNTFLVDTRSSYNVTGINGAVDIVGTATVVTF